MGVYMRRKNTKIGGKTQRISSKMFESKKVGWVQRVGNSVICKIEKGLYVVDVKDANKLKLNKIGDLNKGVQLGVTKFRELVK